MRSSHNSLPKTRRFFVKTDGCLVTFV